MVPQRFVHVRDTMQPWLERLVPAQQKHHWRVMGAGVGVLAAMIVYAWSVQHTAYIQPRQEYCVDVSEGGR